MYSSNKRLAIYLPSLFGGGAEHVMVNLANGLVGHSVSVDLVLAEAKGKFMNEVDHKVRIVDLGARRVLTSLPGLVRYFRRERPDAVLTAMDHANIVTIWAARLAGLRSPVVISIHYDVGSALGLKSVTDKLWLLLMRTFYPLASAIIIVSKTSREQFLRIIGGSPVKVKTIYNPVVTPLLLKKAQEQPHHRWFESNFHPIVVAAGRLSKEKDFSTLLRAFAMVCGHIPARLVILGEGEERHALESLISDLGLQQCVDLPGFVDNPYAFMASASLFVLSSISEALPTVLIEAMAVGTPVVSTDCGGTREILENGKYGRLVPIADPRALADAVLAALRSESDSVSPKDKITDFSLEKICEKYYEVLFSEPQTPHHEVR